MIIPETTSTRRYKRRYTSVLNPIVPTYILKLGSELNTKSSPTTKKDSGCSLSLEPKVRRRKPKQKPVGTFPPPLFFIALPQAPKQKGERFDKSKK
jgi:hypothetical protein